MQYRKRWAKILRFTSPSNHAACDDCLEFKELFKIAKVSCSHNWNCTQLPSLSLSFFLRCTVSKQFQTHKDQQMAYDVAKEYKEHIDSVKRDRELEEWLEAGSLVRSIFILWNVNYLNENWCLRNSWLTKVFAADSLVSRHRLLYRIQLLYVYTWTGKCRFHSLVLSHLSLCCKSSDFCSGVKLAGRHGSGRMEHPQKSVFDLSEIHGKLGTAQVQVPGCLATWTDSQSMGPRSSMPKWCFKRAGDAHEDDRKGHFHVSWQGDPAARPTFVLGCQIAIKVLKILEV